MTEVASLVPSDHRLTTERRYEAGPPEGLQLVSFFLFQLQFSKLK